MILFGDRVVCTAGDLAAAARCEFALLRALDAEAGLVSADPVVPAPPTHIELSNSELFGADHTGDTARLVRIDRPTSGDPADTVAAHTTAHRRTLAALHTGADLILGATFLDGDFTATATALVRLPATGPHLIHPAEATDRPNSNSVATAISARTAGVPAAPAHTGPVSTPDIRTSAGQSAPGDPSTDEVPLGHPAPALRPGVEGPVAARPGPDAAHLSAPDAIHPFGTDATQPADADGVRPADAAGVHPSHTSAVHPSDGDAVYPAGSSTVHPHSGDAAHPADGNAVHLPKADPVPPAGADGVRPVGIDPVHQPSGEAVHRSRAEAAHPSGSETVHPAQGMFEVPGMPIAPEPGRVDGRWTMSMLAGDGDTVDRIIDGDALGATGSGVIDQRRAEEPAAGADAHDGDRYLLYAAVADSADAVAALVELAACAEMLRRNGFVPDPEVWLLLPDGSRHGYPLDRAAAVYAARRRRLARILDEKQNELLPVQWGDRRYLACGQCPTCTAELLAGRDLLLVAGMRPAVRAQLRAAGITTVERLAAADGAVTRVAAHTFAALRRQAELQVQRERTGQPAYTVTDANALAALPEPSPGDVFLVVAGAAVGIGVLAAHTPEGGSPALLFHPFDVQEDPATLPQFLLDRRLRHPGLRIYHYRSDARRLLTELSHRYGADEDLTAELLDALVDLYPVLRTATIIGQRSYDLAAVAGHLDPESAPAGADLESGCARLRWLQGWLGDLAEAQHIPLGQAPMTAAVEPVPAVEAALREFALSATPEDDTAHRAAALMAAVLGYHRRERQPLHWAHADRLHGPVDEWDDAPGVLVSDWGSVDTKWHSTGRPPMRRYLTLTGRLGTGSTPAPGSPVLTLYDRPVPGMTAEPGRRAAAHATILGCALDGNFDDAVRVEEQLPEDCAPYDELPAAIVPGPPGRDENIAAALEFTAHQLLVSLPAVPATAAFDLLCRRRPRLRSGAALPEVCGDHAATVTAAVLDLDESYLAVQGPSGTGKTDTAARVIERLVTRHRWRVGVVAQAHAPVEQLLDALVRVGVLPELVAKSEAQAVAPEWLAIAPARYARFLDNAVNGCVIGGLPGDFADDERVAAGALDLLVIADAGGFPLADTVAVAAGARNLLLLGDPAPLSGNGIHPEPVQESALGRVVGDAPTLPPEFGYFLDRTWRMHPRLCGPVSRLRYGNRLRSNEIVTLARDLAGVPAGVRTAPVQHHGNSTESVEEAREIVRRVRALLGLPWRQGAVTRRLHPHDILVIAPYPAQVARIRTMLSRARIEDVLVGTADRFRGREAAVVLISMTTSSPTDAPHGIGALLSRHWLTAAVARAMWTAVIVHSPLLAEYLPDTPDQLDDLAAFLELSAG